MGTVVKHYKKRGKWRNYDKEDYRIEPYCKGESYTKQGELPEVQIPDYPKNFDICNAADYLQSFELKRIINNRWEKGQLDEVEDAVSEIYKQCLGKQRRNK